ncbi:hypothetical protein KF707_11090 [Candidatus Obscuribacterales bacterium]|nr:hypothetical protein [Candidatus Obscuribacterales bacterium]MBX3150799.1 hypothetical protein [Candidatus Obscuribacterales bacterium]
MDGLPDPSQLTKTGLFRVAKEKPIRPLTSVYLIGLGFTTIALAADLVFQGFQNNVAAVGAAAAAAVLVIWISIAFLWHSVRQLIIKVDALTRLVEKKNDTNH